MKQRKIIGLLIIGLMGLSATFNTNCVRLIGVFNNLSSTATIREPRVELQVMSGTGLVMSEFIESTGDKIETIEKNVQVPIGKQAKVFLKIKYDDSINPDPYYIDITDIGSSESCKGDKTTLNAQIRGIDESKKSVCVSRTITRLLGWSTDVWQNAIIAIANNPKVDIKSNDKQARVPFIFSVSPWATSISPWNQLNILKLPDEPRSARTFEHTQKRITNIRKENGKTKYDKEEVKTGLDIVQGEVAWGGGIVPKLNFGAIVHIYNNTPYILDILRRYPPRFTKELETFRQILAPYAAIPFAMASIPTVAKNMHKDAAGELKEEKPIIEIQATYNTFLPELLLIPAVNWQLAKSADATKISSLGITQIPTDVERIMGRESLVKYFEDPNRDYYINKYNWRILTIKDDKTTVFEKYNRLDKTLTEEQTISTPAFGAGGVPNFFQLIINVDETDPEKGIKLDLRPVTKSTIGDQLNTAPAYNI